MQWALAGLLARVTGLSGSHSMDLRHDQDPGNLYWTWESRRGQLAASAGGSPVQDLLSLAQWVRRLKSRRKGWVYLLTYWLLDPYGVTILLAFSGCVELDWELLPSFYCDLFKAWTALQSSWSPTAGIIGIQISNILVSFNKLKEWIFERYEKISSSNEMLQTNVYKP